MLIPKSTIRYFTLCYKLNSSGFQEFSGVSSELKEAGKPYN